MVRMRGVSILVNEIRHNEVMGKGQNIDLPSMINGI